MRKFLEKSLWLLVLSVCLNTALAGPVRVKQLLNLASNAYSQRQSLAGRAFSSTPLDYRTMTEENDTLLLIVNFADGFVVIAADDAVSPVLAYSLDQQFNFNDTPPAAQMWLDYYAENIRNVRYHHKTPSAQTVREWRELETANPIKSHDPVVSPLLTALWNQTKYYNYYSPFDPDSPGGYDQRTPNGCVAVAMAMIMYYYRYPLHGEGSHTNYTNYGDFFVDFGQTTYCYEAMRDQLNYYNNEVAKLIFHCGTAVDMMYGPDGSGAYSENVPGAMSTYFGYDSQCECLSKHDYSTTQWKSMLKAELDAQRPVYYAGCSEEGCHAFVCDGYASDDYFHFNFGWGGSSNGYYALSSSDEDDVLVGGYSHSQRMVRKIFPRAEYYPYFCSPNNIIKCQSGTLEDGSGTQNYQNNTSCTYVITEDSAYCFHISVASFETQASHDSLSFWDGHPGQGHLLQTLSGSVQHNTSFTFNTDSLYIVFNTDNSETAAGWRLNYQVDRRESSCHSNVIRNYRGTLSDGSGDLPYKSNANCYWRLNLPEASYITISFNYFDLGEGDYLTIFDRTVFPKTPLAVYTGHTIPDEATFTQNYLSIEFYSDNYINGDGFELNWNTDYSPVSVEESSVEEPGIFPNPASQTLYVQMPAGTQKSMVVLYNVAGQQVKMVKAGDMHVLSMDVSDLPSGCYTAVATTEKTSVRKKIIVQH